ncbi:NADH-ubiquinone oxidoreductase chain N [hydrothermal vent metagenome]|uniref:NADH-ubiquinone oxidoreductase chain N n=1 Tax=hydrothermal vent metagenome TaxID=652676 RepID=A0A3B0U229_9ZZZZ
MMDFRYILLMRHELLLVLVAIIILIVDLFTSNEKKTNLINIFMSLFALAMFIGFIPVKPGDIFGGAFHGNILIGFFKNILNLAVMIIFLQSDGYLRKSENSGKVGEFFVLIILTLAGMDFMISSGDFLTFFIGLETASIPMAGLVAFDRYKRRSAEAGVKLILLSALSSGVLLFGLSLIYGATGSIYFSDVAKHITASPLIILGFIFFVSGMGFKISLVPFHLWTADVYEGAPMNITAYLSVVSKGAAAFIFTIILYKVFKNITDIWETVLYTLSVITMTVGNLFALRQDNIKRFLAFSSIAQAGFILLGIMGTGSLGMGSLVYFILIYVFSNLGAFGVASAVYNASGVESISGYNGLYSTNPRLSLVMMLSLFSLAGIPPVAGFFGKFFLFTSAGSQGYFILILIAVLNATVSLYYYLGVVRAMFINKNDNPVLSFRSSNAMRISLLLCGVGLILIGFVGDIFEYILSISYIHF